MGEKSKEYLTAWLANHRPCFIILNTPDSTDFFQNPSRLNLKRRGGFYTLSVFTVRGESVEIELDTNFNAFCMDRYNERQLSIVDSKNTVEIVERYASD